jgi:hypothetical protein
MTSTVCEHNGLVDVGGANPEEVHQGLRLLDVVRDPQVKLTRMLRGESQRIMSKFQMSRVLPAPMSWNGSSARSTNGLWPRRSLPTTP